jgi:hypothetical protein
MTGTRGRSSVRQNGIQLTDTVRSLRGERDDGGIICSRATNSSHGTTFGPYHPCLFLSWFAGLLTDCATIGTSPPLGTFLSDFRS